MPKLTDTQLVILSTAAAREDGAVLPPPDTLKIKGGAVTSVLNSLLKKELIAERPATPVAEVWRESDDDGRMTLVITDVGLQTIGVSPEGEAEAGGTHNEPAPQESSRRVARAKATAGPATTTPPSPRSGTKLALLIDLLRAGDGATIDEIIAATGWQAHSVRGAISGTLKKKLGLTVASEKQDGRGRVYRITGTA
jgi:hypothetical protein